MTEYAPPTDAQAAALTEGWTPTGKKKRAKDGVLVWEIERGEKRRWIPRVVWVSSKIAEKALRVDEKPCKKKA